MSDCSTQAMEPKEPPKACGTCRWFDDNSNCACTAHAVTADAICVCPSEFGHYERAKAMS